MNKKFLLAALATFLLVIIADSLFYALFMEKYLPSPNARAMPDMPFFILGQIIFALVFSYMYPKGVERGTMPEQGAKYGVLIALMYGLAMDLILFASTTGWTLQQVLVDSVYRVLILAIAGIVVAFIYKLPFSRTQS